MRNAENFNTYLGHIMRNKCRHDLLQRILQVNINSKRSPERRRTSWLVNLRTWFDKSSVELFRSATNSTNKSRITMMIAKIRNGLRRRIV